MASCNLLEGTLPSVVDSDLKALCLSGVAGRSGGSMWDLPPQRIRAARLQNETAPEKNLTRYEKRFEKREQRSEKRSETPFRDSELFSTKWVAETPIFIVFFGCALFGPSCQKREILDTHQKKGKN